MKKPYSEMSEGELMEALLDMLPPDGQFMLGVTMGVMSKGNRTRIAALEQDVKETRAALASRIDIIHDLRERITQHEIANEEAE